MQAVLLMGIQATGKSSFWRSRFGNTHVRINLDMLRTRHRESRILAVCCETQMAFVVDNTNPTVADRERYIAPAKEAGMKVIGYYFQSSIEAALARNAARKKSQRVPDLGIRATHARLELPTWDEGFDELYYVSLGADDFQVDAWQA